MSIGVGELIAALLLAVIIAGIVQLGFALSPPEPDPSPDGQSDPSPDGQSGPSQDGDGGGDGGGGGGDGGGGGGDGQSDLQSYSELSEFSCAGACVNASGYYLRATPDMSQPDRRAQCCEQSTCKDASVVCPTGKKQREGFDTLPIETHTQNAEEVCCVTDLGRGSCGSREPAKQTGGSREGELGSCAQAGKCHYGRNGGYAKCCGGLYNAVNGKMCVADEDEEQCKDGPTVCI